MNKQEFYDVLSDRLLALDVEQTYIDRHIKQFEDYFAGKNDSQISDEIAKMGDMDRLVLRIKRMTDNIIATEKASSAAVDKSSQTAKDSTMAMDAVNPAAGDADEDVSHSFGHIKSGVPEKAEAGGKPFAYDDDFDELFAEEDEPMPPDADTHGRKADEASSPDSLLKQAPSSTDLRERKKKFYLLLALSSPLWIIALLLIAAAFATVYFVIGMIIVLAIGCLIADTAAGAVLSILGLSFAVVRMTSSVPIGLYEFGVSVMIGAAAMLIGVLIYNFIVRLMPFAALKFVDLTKYVINRLKKLYFNFKKERIGG